VAEDRFLEGRVAVVTGASSGIGRAIAIRLAAAGASLALASRRGESLEDVAGEIAAAGGRAIAIRTDVLREDEIVRLMETTRSQLGPIDILVNSAGKGYVSRVFRIDAEKLDEVMALNFRAAVLCAKHVVKEMITRKSGSIVNIGSISGKQGWADGTPYVASKFALRGFAQCLWTEVHEHQVRVINIYPDYVGTDFFDKANVKFPAIDMAVRPETIADMVAVALRLPPNTNVTEIEVKPTHL
jgi:NADP-dependent 3-hydroxy acid dehydrogenase YdfG